MITWAAPGAKAHERAALKLSNGCIPFEGIKHGCIFNLHTIKTSKHMGTKISKNVSVGEEVATRVAAMSTGAKRLQTIINYNDVELSIRTKVVMMYLIAKGFCNSGTLPELSAALYTKLHHALLRICRSLLGATFDSCDEDAVI